MTRAELRQVLKMMLPRGAMRRAAKAAGISPSHLANCLARRDQLSLTVAAKLVRHLQRLGVEISLSDLAEERAQRRRQAPGARA